MHIMVTKMARPKSKFSGIIAKRILEFFPEDGSKVYWTETEKKAVIEGFSNRTFLKYVSLLEKAGKITKCLDPESRRPRYLYSRQSESSRLIRQNPKNKERRVGELKIIKSLMGEVAAKVKETDDKDVRSQIIAAFFSDILPEIMLSISIMLSEYASFDKSEDAETYLDVNIELDLIPIIKELAHNIPQNIDTWAPAVDDFFDNVIAPTRKKVIEKMNKLVYDE